MNFYEAILLAERWEDQFSDFTRLIVTLEKDLAAYKQKEGANPKAVAIKQEVINRLRAFGELTATLVDVQAELLQQHKKPASLNPSPYEQYLQRFNNDREQLKILCAKNGIDKAQWPYMKLSDFRN